MARGTGKKSGRRPQGSTQERQAAAAGYRQAVDSLQQSAYWNLRTRIATASVVLGVLALMVVAFGDADGARLVPTLVCALGAAPGAGVYFSRPYPGVNRWLLIAGTTLSLVGIIGLIIVVQVTG